MPTPTVAELWDQYAKFCKLYDEVYQFGAVNGSSLNWLDLQDSVIQALEGSHYNTVANNIGTSLSSLANLYLSGKQGAEAILRNILKIGYTIPDTGLNIQQVCELIAESLSDNSHTVKSRDYTLGTITADGSNVGSGVIYRTTKDKNNATIEVAQPGTVKIEVVNDKSSGARIAGQERIKFYGSGIRKENEIDLGTATNEVKETSFRTSQSPTAMVVDGSFENFVGSADANPSSAVQGQWIIYNSSDAKDKTVVQIIDKDSSSPDFYRYHKNTGSEAKNGRALKFVSDGYLSQYAGRNNRVFLADRPYILVARWMRKASATGNLTLALGSQTATTTIGSGTNDQWNSLVLGASTSTGDNEGWYDNFKQDWSNSGFDPADGEGVRIRFEVDTLATGTVIVDEIVCEPGFYFNGHWYFPISGGADGDMVKGDFYTVSDSENATGRIQYTTARYFGKSFPSTTGTPTYADA